MNGIELFKKDGSDYTPVDVFYCSNEDCRLVYKSKALADECCLCCDCKEKRIVGRCRCKPCGDKHQDTLVNEQQIKAKAVMDKAEVVEEFEYIWFNESMYDSVESLIEDHFDGPLPEFVHAMKPVNFTGFDASDLFETFDESNMCEDVYCEDQLLVTDELRAYIAEFNIANRGVVVFWEEDTTRKVKVK